MSAPAPVVRAVVYERDGHRCISCGATRNLSFQHRQAVGMGGSKRLPSLVEGLTACMPCNAAYEAHLSDQALRYGWKVPRWVTDCSLVPVFDQQWFRLDRDGWRIPIGWPTAVALMRDAYGPEYEDVPV